LKRLLLLTALLALIPAPVSASCGFGCLHRQIEAIRRQTLPQRVSRLEERLTADEKLLTAQDQYIGWLEGWATKLEAQALKFLEFQQCFAEIPLTRYGEPTGPSGYLFHLDGPEPRSIPTTALDLTYPNDPVGAWVLVDACNLGSDARGFREAGNQQLVAMKRELSIEDFVGQQDGKDRPSLSYTPLFPDQPR
jgi:hypothetical protein